MTGSLIVSIREQVDVGGMVRSQACNAAVNDTRQVCEAMMSSKKPALCRIQFAVTSAWTIESHHFRSSLPAKRSSQQSRTSN